MNNKNLKFAINHCSCPHLSPKELINLAENLGIPAVELRNDIKENKKTLSDVWAGVSMTEDVT